MSALEGKAQRSGAGVGDQHFAGVGLAAAELLLTNSRVEKQFEFE